MAKIDEVRYLIKYQPFILATTDYIQTVVQPFISDLAKYKQSVVISCPKVKLGRYSHIIERLIGMVANGKEIVLYTKDNNNDTIRLQQHGISVIYRDHLGLHTAIIDKNIIWYGSVKILGFHSTEDNLIRFKNAEIASNLLESLQK